MEFGRCYRCMADLSKNTSPVCPECGFNNAAAEQPPQALPCGSVLKGRYIVGCMLGQGGFGITYIGYDWVLETTVCIKEFFPSGIAVRVPDRTGTVYWSGGTAGVSVKLRREAFVSEARKAVKVRSLSSVVNVWDVFYEKETAYIIMEYIRGMTVKEYLLKKGAPMEAGECLSLLGPVIRDLHKVHGMGIIHRDISPDNLMIREEDGKVMLLDLGAAKDLANGSGQSSAIVYKRGYSPIEQYSRNSRIGSWTDVYAMSATLYWCLTGECVPEATERIVKDTLAFPQYIPPNIVSVLRRGLSVRAEDRIADCLVLIEELEKAPEHQKKESVGSDFEKTLASAMQGDPMAQYNLGIMYENGNGVEKSSIKAVEWYTKAAEQGLADAQNTLGVRYEQGRGVEQSYKKAVDWYRKAADQGNARAQFNLGNKYYKGYGVEQKYEKAAEWYRKAALQGHDIAQFLLGTLHEEGKGVQRSVEVAEKWYKKSAEQGNDSARKCLSRLLSKKDQSAESSRKKPVNMETHESKSNAGKKTFNVGATSSNTSAETAGEWVNIVAASKDGSYKEKYRIGDRRKLDMGAEGIITMKLVAMDEDTLADGNGKAHMTWIAEDLLKTEHNMNSTNTNSGGWEVSEMRSWLKETVFPLMPKEVKNNICEVMKNAYMYEWGRGDESAETIWIPSVREMFLADGSKWVNRYYENMGVAYTGIFKDNASRVRSRNGSSSASWWWLRTAHYYYSTRYCAMSGSGSLGNSYAANEGGVVIGFCL